MGRTRLRGIDLAGYRTVLEVPSGFDWRWPSVGLSGLSIGPYEEDIYISVRVTAPEFPLCDSILYSHRGATFEVGRVDDDWWIAVRGSSGLERVARFDHEFRHGEVTVSPRLVAHAEYPLMQPIDELLYLHRLLADDGMLLRGTALVRDHRAQIVLGSHAEPAGEVEQGGWREIDSHIGSSKVIALRLDEGVARVFGAASGGLGSRAAFEPLSARVEAIHIVRANGTVGAERLEYEEAATQILTSAIAPVHAPDCADQLLRTADRLANRVSVLQIDRPHPSGVRPFDWGEREAGLAFAPPV